MEVGVLEPMYGDTFCSMDVVGTTYKWGDLY